MLTERDILLARHGDATLSAEERLAAVSEANAVLSRIIEVHREDPRVAAWRFDLVRSTLYQEAEPHYLNILYRGGTSRDRARLAQLMERVAGTLALLRIDLSREFERMDRVAPGRYDDFERSGYVDRLEGMQPKIAYMERWVKLYRALAREERDPLRVRELRELLDDLRDRSGLLDTPHRESHVQAQARLMAGIAARLAGDAESAGSDLQSAADIVRRLPAERERQDLGWVGHLARFELVKVYRDRRAFDRAWDALREFQTEASGDQPEGSGFQLAAALLSADLYTVQSNEARAAGKPEEARKYASMRYEALMRFARRGHSERDAAYAALYETLGRPADLAGLHPFEGCALVAGLLADAASLKAKISEAREAGESATSSAIAELEAGRLSLLDRAIAAAEAFQRDRDRVPPELRSEIAYGLAVGQFQRGLRLEAARGFMAIARDDPRFRLAEHAASVAVQIAAELAEDPSLRDRADVRELHLESLKTLSSAFPESGDARYWRFFLAQTLQQQGRFAEAADVYARVPPDHEHYVEAGLLRVRALHSDLGAMPHADDAQRLEDGVNAVIEAAEACRERAEAARRQGDDAAKLADLLAESEVLAAEAKLALGAAQAGWVLDRLQGFEERYPDRNRLWGRVLRARILAYEHLDRWAEAEQALPDYVRRDPHGAGATLQGLFDSIRGEIEQLGRQGRTEDVQRKSAAALVLARRIQEWARAADSGVGPEGQYAVDLQLGEALLRAETFAEARDVFARCAAADAERHEDRRPRDFQAVHGHAEALFQLKAYEEALPLFNRLSRETRPDDPLRFKGLLRDLQCRTELGHPADGIIKVIRQQKFLEGDMGGLRAEFDSLLKLNEARPAGSN